MDRYKVTFENGKSVEVKADSMIEGILNALEIKKHSGATGKAIKCELV